MTKTILIIIFSLCLTAIPVNSICKKCPVVRCVVVTPEDCKSNEVFVRRDGYCHCCDACVKRECQPNLCALVFCAPSQPDMCNPKTQVYEEPDGICNCCGRCVTKI